MTAMHWIGVDPGVSGGAVCLAPDGRTVVWACSWHILRRVGGPVWRVRWHDHDASVPARTLGEVAELCRHLTSTEASGGWRLSVEALFGRGPSVIRLAETAGRFLGGLEVPGTPTHRPRSRDWRKRVLGIEEALLGAKASEEVAVRMAPTLFRGLGQLEQDGHVVEAACIALDGLRCQPSCACTSRAQRVRR